MNYLKQNRKMQASENDESIIFNFGIPAFQSRDGFRTCKKAGACVKGCYAKQGTYNFPVVVDSYERSLTIARGSRTKFDVLLSADIETAILKADKHDKQLFIRIHDSGDFFSVKYFNMWRALVDKYPQVEFYCYTKEIALFESFKSSRRCNLRYVYSYGGKEDHLIKPEHAHSRVFETKAELDKAGYIDATDDDLRMFEGHKIGLVYHGNKKFSNTAWGRVK